MFCLSVSAGCEKLILNGVKIFAKARRSPLEQLCRRFEEQCMQRPLFNYYQDTKLLASSDGALSVRKRIMTMLKSSRNSDHLLATGFNQLSLTPAEKCHFQS